MNNNITHTSDLMPRNVRDIPLEIPAGTLHRFADLAKGHQNEISMVGVRLKRFLRNSVLPDTTFYGSAKIENLA